jgi:uncharacterized protein (TIGR03435 family)
MNDYAFPKLTFGINPLLAAAILAALPLPACLAQVGAAQSSTPSLPANAPYVATMTFDVTSIHESRPGPEMHFVGGSFAAHSGNLTLENVDLFWLLSIGYGVDYHQISGKPDWAGRTTFNVQAKSDDAANEKMATLDNDQVKLEQQHMMQALLAERFNLKVHWSTQEGDIYRAIRGETYLQGQEERAADS